MRGPCPALLLWVPLLVNTMLLGACVPNPPATPPPGALRVVQSATEEALGIPVTLAIHDQRSDQNWFFLIATPLTGTGGPVNYGDTRLADRAAEGEFDDWLCALLRKSGSNTWELLELEIGATDVPFIDWPDRYGVPVELIMGKTPN